MRSSFSISVWAFLFAFTVVTVNAASANGADARWADWLERLENRATVHRSFDHRLADLRAEHRRLQLAASSNRLYDLQGEYGGDYTRTVYENVIAQAQLMMERTKALEQPLEKGSRTNSPFLVHSFPW